MSQPNEPAILFALPCGLSLGGVTTWAVRLANELASRGRNVGMMLHAPRRGDAPGKYELDPRVKRFALDGIAPMDELHGAAHAFEPEYRRAIDAMRSSRVVCLPSLMGDCYGVFAACSRTRSEVMRVVGWAHLYSPYELRVLEHYASLISRFVAVSDELFGALRAQIPVRADHISNIPYGVEIPPPRERKPSDRLRIAYIGRLDEDIKRVDVLPAFSAQLTAAGVAHTLVVAGDGPAANRFESLEAEHPSIHAVGAISPRDVGALLDVTDVLVLPSRAEGLPLVLQEAMARGCVPVVCGGASGIAQLVEDSVTGMVVESTEDRALLATALARSVRRAMSLGLAPLGAAAAERIRRGYALAACHHSMISVLDAAASDPPRAWPLDREWMFTSTGSGGSGTVPPDGAARLRRTLEMLDGRKVLVYGTGRHTVELLPVVREFAPSVVGFIDDDPSRRGVNLEARPVLAPAEAKSTGASDVVISSWIHEQAMWERREIFEREGIRVHRLYAD